MFKILCTGNPTHPTIASGIKKIFPEAEFASRATGYDLRMWDPIDEEFFCNNIIKYNVLINSAFVSAGAQQKILELTQKCWKVGHIFNIGSTAEYEGRNSFFPAYSIQKRSLRDLSLALNKKYFKTTHITVGGLDDGKEENKNNLDPIEVANVIKWILEYKHSVPIIGVEKL